MNEGDGQVKELYSQMTLWGVTELLQGLINVADCYRQKWKLKANVSKSAVMAFGFVEAK